MPEMHQEVVRRGAGGGEGARCRTLAVAGLLVLLVVPPAVHAQHIRGRLLDLDSNEPVVAGLLTLVDTDGSAVITAVTDNEGYWILQAPAPGVYFVRAKRIGYQPWLAGPLEVRPGDDLNSVFHLRRLPVMLDPIDITAEATEQYLAQAGFYRRQNANFGHYMGPAEIERRRATTFTDLLTGIPGVNLLQMTSGSVGARYIQLRGSNLSHGGVCRPRVFVDGLMYARGDSRPKRITDSENTEQALQEQLQQLDQGMSLDDIGHPSTIAAIEIYRSASQVPVQYGGTSVETQCGVILIWTRTGRMRTRN